MTTRAPDIFKVVASAGLVVLMTISAANAQVRPNPPSDVFIDGGTTLPSGLLFFDDFNYVVDTNPANATANRAAYIAAGWAGAKATNLGDRGARGNLSTVRVSSIPGLVGSAPSPSPRALRLNSNALTEGGQTDFYLRLGDGTPNSIPGNVWFQFWLYPNRSGAEQSAFHGREKFLYPTQGSAYPSSDLRWLWMLSTDSYDPSNARSLSAGNAYVVSRDAAVSPPNNTLAVEYPGNASKLGQTSIREYIAANRWTLVKIHYDTTSAQGTYECWMRPQGGAWTKVAEWIGGVTPGFTWTIPAQNRGGHHQLVMPSTFPGANVTPSANAWIYMQDFAMATDEASLPVYSD